MTNPTPNPVLPIIRRAKVSTMASDLVGVVPMGPTPDLVAEVRRINRDRKIEAITEDKPYEEMRVEDHPDYRGPFGELFYLDYSYGGSTSSSSDPHKPGGRRGPKNRTLGKWDKLLNDMKDESEGNR